MYLGSVAQCPLELIGHCGKEKRECHKSHSPNHQVHLHEKTIPISDEFLSRGEGT